MNLGQAGLNMIKEFEGFRSAPYRDSVGVWTIGYGSTSGVGPNTPHMTEQQAADRLRREVDQRYGAAVNSIGVPLTQNQFDALTSFVYNVGPGGVASNSNVGRALRARDYQAAADGLLAWDHAGGQRLAGLTRRRQAERALFLSGAPSHVPTPALNPADDDGEHTGMSWLFPQTAPGSYP
jgi:GH24 family phage-related lysozyme (muramidase)